MNALNQHHKNHTRHNNDNENNVVSRIDKLGDDILLLILSKIDSWKLLVQCRSVSKRWNNIIYQPIFLDLISLKFFPFTLYVVNRHKTFLISEHPFFQSQNPPFDLDFHPFCDHKYKLNVIGSYYDLLIYCSPTQYFRLNKQLYYYFCNPITRKYVQIEIPINYNNDGGNLKAIGCTGKLEGISSVKGEGGFKFVRIISRSYFSNDILQVFSFESGKWSTSRITLKFDLRLTSFHSYNSVTVNNKLHWLLYDSILVIDPYSNDISRYRLIELPFPPSLCTLGVCQERLRVAEFAYITGPSFVTLNVWELADYNKSTWTIVCMKVITTTIVHPIIYGPLKKRLEVTFHPYDCDVVYLETETKIVRYNLKSDTFKMVLDEWAVIYPLVNSLVVA
ncbi:uncharacterized protein LOC110738920 [Chenopodium quinoa]|uniref:F-box domain-containing protein n=1 Tax=Chenopodium quinoa TaxID=63459 RepID=A0A803MUW3_CHEQI|nr:uncharacterized protein LOC110738920 [Chenopodium quinoa]